MGGQKAESEMVSVNPNIVTWNVSEVNNLIKGRPEVPEWIFLKIHYMLSTGDIL